jgi:nitrogenase subunit NifH
MTDANITFHRYGLDRRAIQVILGSMAGRMEGHEDGLVIYSPRSHEIRELTRIQGIAKSLHYEEIHLVSIMSYIQVCQTFDRNLAAEFPELDKEKVWARIRDIVAVTTKSVPEAMDQVLKELRRDVKTVPTADRS